MAQDVGKTIIKNNLELKRNSKGRPAFIFYTELFKQVNYVVFSRLNERKIKLHIIFDIWS